MTKDSFVFFDDNYKNVKCMICGEGTAYCWYDYYDESRLHCKDCFYNKTKYVVSKFIETGEKDYDVLQYWIVGYKSLYQRYEVEMRLKKQLQENIVRLVSDKMQMQNDIDTMKRHLELKDGVSIGYDFYKSALNDNDKLREQIKTLEKELETWKKASVENHGAYQSAMKYASDWKDKYIKEKMDHTTTKSRIIFAKHILDGNRDERVLEHMEKNEF